MSINNYYPLLTLTITRHNDDEPVFLEKDSQVEKDTQIGGAADNSSSDDNSISINNVQTSYAKNIASMLVSDIKQKIYNYSHTQDTSAITTSYGTTFDDIMKSLNISPGGKIKKSKLIAKARIDSKEDNNNDLCGALNRAFSYKGANEDITYKDMMLFFMRGAGSDSVFSMDEYQTVVNKYSDIVQDQYDSLTSDQERLEFIIDKTEQYFSEAGLTMQQEALDRLKAANNITESGKTLKAAVGNITLLEFKKADGTTDTNTGGAYASLSVAKSETNGQQSGFWVGDTDTTNNDFGISLNNYFFERYHWFDLVMILVHELTHASAYRYYDNNGVYSKGFDTDVLDDLVKKGIISSNDVDNYKNFDIETNAALFLQALNASEKYTSYTEDEKKALAYAMLYVDDEDPQYTYTNLTRNINALWNEFAAYYMTNEYYDSIGADAIECRNASRLTNSGNYLQYFDSNFKQDGSNAEYEAIKEHLYKKNSDAYGSVPNVEYAQYEKFGTLFFNA